MRVSEPVLTIPRALPPVTCVHKRWWVCGWAVVHKHRWQAAGETRAVQQFGRCRDLAKDGATQQPACRQPTACYLQRELTLNIMLHSTGYSRPPVGGTKRPLRFMTTTLLTVWGRCGGTRRQHTQAAGHSTAQHSATRHVRSGTQSASRAKHGLRSCVCCLRVCGRMHAGV